MFTAAVHAQPAYDTCLARCELGTRWERGVFKFDKAIEDKVDTDGRIPSQEYWGEAGKASDRIMLQVQDIHDALPYDFFG
jgi:hypothetical protein